MLSIVVHYPHLLDASGRVKKAAHAACTQAALHDKMAFNEERICMAAGAATLTPPAAQAAAVVQQSAGQIPL